MTGTLTQQSVTSVDETREAHTNTKKSTWNHIKPPINSHNRKALHTGPRQMYVPKQMQGTNTVPF
jgi:hypothetical protein